MKLLNKNVVLSALLYLVALNVSAQIKTSDLNKSYNTVIFPNNSDVVGKIFAVAAGKPIPITSLDVTVKSTDIVVGEYTKTKDFTWGMVLSFLGVSGTSVSGNASLNGKSDVVKKITYKQTRQYTMDLLEANSLIKAKRKELADFAKDNDLKGMKFYLIIENITAKQVDYGFTKKVSGKDSIDLKLNEIGTVNPSVSYTANTDYQIHYQLPNELTVLYSVLPLKPPVAQLTGDQFMLTVGSDTSKRELISIGNERK